jgi:hypothetical protein
VARADRRADDEPCLPELQQVAHVRAEHDEERAVHDRAARFAQPRPLAGRRGFDRAVERVTRVHAAHLHEPRRRAARRERHRAERDDARDVGRRARRASRLLHERLRAVGQGSGRADDEIGPEERACLAPHGLAQVLGERVDGDEGRHADRDREHDQEAPAA